MGRESGVTTLHSGTNGARRVRRARVSTLRKSFRTNERDRQKIRMYQCPVSLRI